MTPLAVPEKLFRSEYLNAIAYQRGGVAETMHSPWQVPRQVLSTVQLYLKQVSLEDLNEMGVAAMNFACERFMTWEPPQATRDAARHDLASLMDLASDKIKLGSFTGRRFAGDMTLSRGRYHTIATDAQGTDGGTLYNELLAYLYPKEPSWVSLVDLTTPAARAEATEELGVDLREPALVWLFPPRRGRPHPFAAQFASERVPVMVAIPVRITRHRLTKIVDLRRPETAQWFARTMTAFQFALEEGGEVLDAFPDKPAVEGFQPLIPTILEQSLGSNQALCSMAGLYLRHAGVNGLIYPSARTDSFVRISGGQLRGSQGWNFVDYRDCEPPAMSAMLDLDEEWPATVGVLPDRLNGLDQPLLCPDVEIHYTRSGRRKGSWSVTGLSERTSAKAGFLLAGCMIEEDFPNRHEEIMAPVWRLHASLATGKLQGETASALCQAIYGDEESLAALARYAERLKSDGLLDIATSLTQIVEAYSSSL